VEDHVRGIDTALRHGEPGLDYNVGAGGETDGVTVADTVLRLLGRPASLKQFVRDRLGHDRRYAVDSTRLTGLGWRPTLSFEAGMERTVAWFVEHEEWWRPLKSGEFWEFYQRNYQPAAEPRAATS
jgi:dTDP-glucose 4,6-dehydratase